MTLNSLIGQFVLPVGWKGMGDYYFSQLQVSLKYNKFIVIDMLIKHSKVKFYRHYTKFTQYRDLAIKIIGQTDVSWLLRNTIFKIYSWT